MVAYCSREDVMRASDIKLTAYSSARIDRAVVSASAWIDRECHWSFLPVTDTRTLPVDEIIPDKVWLDENPLQSVSAITDGGTAVTDYTLYPIEGGDNAGNKKPYTWIEFDTSPSEDEVVVTGVFGYQAETTAVTTLDGEINAAVTSMAVASGLDIGVGFHYLLGTEYVKVTERSFKDTTTNLSAALTAASTDTVITIAGVDVGEVLMVDAERMLVLTKTATTVVVGREYDGSTLAAHSNAADIYASRTLTIVRGQLGSTAAIHLDGVSVSLLEVPSPIRDLAIGLTIDTLQQESSGYSKLSGSGDNEREARTPALMQKRNDVVRSYGRVRVT